MAELRFYDPRDPATGFLSNFYRAPFQLDGFEWPTVEHYYQAQKFEDAAYCERIRLAATPREAKTLGQAREKPVRADWETRRMTAMLQALVAKFTQNAELQKMLLAIEDEVNFVEASPQDNFWGDGADGKGENRLGYLLTTTRRHLRRFLVNQNNNPSDDGDLATLCFQSVQRMHVDWWWPDSVRWDTQATMFPDELSVYVRDVDLPDGYLERYPVGLIFREPTFCDASEHSKQGLAAKHRYFLLSSHAKHVDALFGGASGAPGTGLSIFAPDTFWKVLAVNEAAGHAQITLLEIPPQAVHAFDGQRLSPLLQGLADQAAERFTQALQLPVLEACKSTDWLDRIRHPLGIRDDGVFLESLFNGWHEQAPMLKAVQDVVREKAITIEPQKQRLKRALGFIIMLLGIYIGYVVAQTDSRPVSVIVFASVIVLFGALVAWRPDSVK
jgi:N-glycosidase YbiA